MLPIVNTLEEAPMTTSPEQAGGVRDEVPTSALVVEGDDAAHSTSCCCCCCKRQHPFLGGNPEAVAWMLDTIATSIIFVGSGAFLTTTLIKLAKAEAGCETERPEGEHKIPDCNNKVHGMKPSSLLSTYATAITLTAAVMMPLCGAIVDTTSYRRGLGRILAALFALGTLATIFVSEDNWYAMSIVFACVAFVGLFETMALYSYLPELTSNEDTLNRYTKTFAVLSYASMVLYLAVIVGISTGVAFKADNDTLDDEIGTARLSQTVAFSIGAICFSIAWGRLFKHRPPARTLEPSESVWTAGFVQLYHTAIKVHRRYPMLQWFFAAIAVGDAASAALLILGITFMTDVLEFTGAENGTVVLIMLISSIPGGYLSSWWSHRYNPVSTSIAAVCLLIINTTLVAALLKGPDQAMGAYLLAICWGIGTGAKWTVDRLLYAMILPKNQNAEFSGSYVFFRQCLTWLPPLVFTVLNESDVSLRWGMGSVNIFFVIALVFLYFGVGIQRYDEYVARRNDDDAAVAITPTSDGGIEKATGRVEIAVNTTS